MTHPDPIEIHDHVYGFRASSHVPGCPDCAAAAERVDAERRALRDALAEAEVEPPADLLRPRRRFSWTALASAAGLLAALAWLLVSPPSTLVPAAPTPDDQIRRLVAELRSPSQTRREIALEALRTYGAQVHPYLVEAGVDRSIREPFRTPSAEDLRKEAVLDTIKKDFSFENMPAGQVFERILAEVPIPATIAEEVRETLEHRPITFKVKDLTLRNVLKLLFSQFSLDMYVLDGRLLIGTPRVFMTSLLPIRVGPDDPGADTLVRRLGAEDAETRERAVRDLRRLDFAAEKALWAALDGVDPEVAGRAADLLRALYRPKERRTPVPNAHRLDLRHPITADFEEETLIRIVDALRDQTKLNMHVYALSDPDQKTATFSCRDLPVGAAFRLLLDPLRLEATNRDFVVIIGPAVEAPGEAVEEGPFWADVETAGRIQRALAGLGTPEEDAVLVELAHASIGPLRVAARGGNGAARELLIRIYVELDLRLADDPPTSYLASLGTGAREILDRRVSAEAHNETLAALLRRHGAAVREDRPDPRTFTFKIADVSIRAILDALTRISPEVDWRFEGETIVLDTPARTRAAAER